MTYTLDQLLEMKQEDLIELANNEFDQNVSKKYSKSQIASLVMAKQIMDNEGKQFGNVTALPDGAEVDNTIPKGYCVMRLNNSFRNPNGTPVPIGLNGNIDIAPVGKNFQAPEHFIEILSYAMEEQITGLDNNGRAKSSWVHAYPFTVYKHNPSDKWPRIQEEIDKFENGLESSFTEAAAQV